MAVRESSSEFQAPPLLPPSPSPSPSPGILPAAAAAAALENGGGCSSTTATAATAGHLQSQLQSAVQSVQWTYSVFWQVCPQQGVLVWCDGYYNGAIKTRKTVQPIEVSTEEVCLQRSQQLRELYESLSAGDTNQPSRRPCAALSPEDLTESEWFYLMCISFSFPHGVGLPGKAFARRQHIWLTGANEMDSKVFSRAILAKSARIQTVLCIPVSDGVLELGTTDRIQEDVSVVNQAKSFFVTDHNQSKPVCSEHSTSNTITSTNRNNMSLAISSQLRHLPPPPASPQLPSHNLDQLPTQAEGNADSGSDAETTYHNDNLQPPPPIVQPAADMIEPPSELMELEMSADIRLGSPEDCSNNLDSELQMLAVSNPAAGDHEAPSKSSYMPHTAQPWTLLQEDMIHGIQDTPGMPQLNDFAQEDAHYSQTVSTILQHNSTRWSESRPYAYWHSSYNSAFSAWSYKSDDSYQAIPMEGNSQWLLKYILFTVPFLHNKYRDENSPKAREGESSGKFKKGAAPQDDQLSVNHVLAERRRREKLNERFIILRSLVPFVTKMDKASILGDTIEYVKQLRRRIQDLESRNKTMEGELKARSTEASNTKERVSQISNSKASSTTQRQVEKNKTPILDKRKLRVLEGAGAEKIKVAGGPVTIVQVSIIENDALLELQCPYREMLLLDIMQVLVELRLETQSVQSSSANGVFVAEIRAKVREGSCGKKASIMEVKQAIHHTFLR